MGAPYPAGRHQPGTNSVARRCLDEAVDHLWRLHRAGWPVGRTLPNLAPALAARFTRPATEITSALHDIAEAERSTDWEPIADARAPVSTLRAANAASTPERCCRPSTRSANSQVTPLTNQRGCTP